MTTAAPPKRRIVPFRPEHAERLDPQEHQRWTAEALRYGPEFWSGVLCRSEAITMLRGERVIGFGGVTWLDDSGSVSWAYFSAEAGPADMLYAYRQAREWLAGVAADYGLAEIRTVADDGFPAAHRWLKMLGYRCEAFLPQYLKGRDHWLYVRRFDHG